MQQICVAASTAPMALPAVKMVPHAIPPLASAAQELCARTALEQQPAALTALYAFLPGVSAAHQLMFVSTQSTPTRKFVAHRTPHASPISAHAAQRSASAMVAAAPLTMIALQDSVALRSGLVKTLPQVPPSVAQLVCNAWQVRADAADLLVYAQHQQEHPPTAAELPPPAYNPLEHVVLQTKLSAEIPPLMLRQLAAEVVHCATLSLVGAVQVQMLLV
jgi:hypothetical protein